MSSQDYNLYTHFHRAFDGIEQKTALTTIDNDNYSFADIDGLSGQIANFLGKLGLRPGDRVSAQLNKSPQNLFLYLACLRAGLVFHPLNPGYKEKELEYFIGDAEPAIVICDPEHENLLGKLARTAAVKHIYTINSEGNGSLKEGCRGEAKAFDTVTSEKDQLAALLYSSGTTGVPKGIMLSHNNLLSNLQSLIEAWGFSAADRLLHALPIFHVHGLFVAVGCTLLSGASMRWLEKFDTRDVRNLLPECTVMMGVPTYYTRLLANESFGVKECEKMRLFISGSAPLLEETFEAFRNRTGHTILERYGMTETNMNTTNPLNAERKAGTVGPALPGVQVRVVDDNGIALASGSAGNLQVRGPNVFVGYWRLPEKTASDFTEDGFFNTGDLASIDAAGYVSIIGRAKDLVITGGLNVYPKEVELFIDGLLGVKESAIIGIPHADYGEGVVAVVVLTGDEAITAKRIIDACRSSLANFKVPKKVVFVEELPRNAMAKVQKQHLRKAYKTVLS